MRTPIVFSRKYTIEDAGHIFKASKFEAVLKLLLKEGVIDRSDVVEPEPPTENDLLLAHKRSWVKKILRGRLSLADQARAELAASPGMLRAHLMNVGGTMLAGRLALSGGLGINCGGGAHHAFPDHGEGFCLLNDIAVAVNRLRRDGAVKKALIIDLDVHQGNGTAAMFRRCRDVFTFSIHQEGIYPEVREPGSLDLELPAGAGNDRYLGLLEKSLPGVLAKARPGLVIYNAGVDVYRQDLLGGMKLTMDGVRLRDEMVFRECFRRKLPVALVLSGGYALKFSDTVRLRANTIKAALRLKKKMPAFRFPGPGAGPRGNAA